MTSTQPSPLLDSQLFRLNFPRSLGTYSTYAEVQAVVDALADADFPVQNTMIVGTDLKLVERVTGRKTWGKVLMRGASQGLFMGLFIGVLMSLLGNSLLGALLPAMLMGVVFFTVWAGIEYAMTGGRRDFTSVPATIPMQYELLVEHSSFDNARQILTAAGAMPAPSPAEQSAPIVREGRPVYGQPAPAQERAGDPSAAAASGNRPSYGQSAPAVQGAQGSQSAQGANPSGSDQTGYGYTEGTGHMGYGRTGQDQPGYGYGETEQAAGTEPSGSAAYGQAPGAPEAQPSGAQPSGDQGEGRGTGEHPGDDSERR